MSTRTSTEAVWQSMSGATPLRERYGYWPMFHDAVIRSMRIGYKERDLEIVLDYSDANAVTEKELETRITLCWRGIIESRLRLNAGDLYGVNFLQAEGWIETQFEKYSWGLDGFIRSASLEVVGIELEPVKVSRDDPASSEILFVMK